MPCVVNNVDPPPEQNGNGGGQGQDQDELGMEEEERLIMEEEDDGDVVGNGGQDEDDFDLVDEDVLLNDDSDDVHLLEDLSINDDEEEGAEGGDWRTTSITGVMKYLANNDNPSTRKDLILKVQDVEIRAHTLFLSIVSPLFYQRVQEAARGGMVSFSWASPLVIDMGLEDCGEDADAVRQMVDFVYTRKMPDSKGLATDLNLLKLATKFGILDLKSKVLASLRHQVHRHRGGALGLEGLVAVLELGIELGDQHLIKWGNDGLCRRAEELLESDTCLLGLSQKALANLLNDDCFCAPEMMIIDAVLNWAEDRISQNGQTACTELIRKELLIRSGPVPSALNDVNILDLIRFPLLSGTELTSFNLRMKNDPLLPLSEMMNLFLYATYRDRQKQANNNPAADAPPPNFTLRYNTTPRKRLAPPHSQREEDGGGGGSSRTSSPLRKRMKVEVNEDNENTDNEEETQEEQEEEEEDGEEGEQEREQEAGSDHEEGGMMDVDNDNNDTEGGEGGRQRTESESTDSSRQPSSSSQSHQMKAPPPSFRQTETEQFEQECNEPERPDVINTNEEDSCDSGVSAVSNSTPPGPSFFATPIAILTLEQEEYIKTHKDEPRHTLPGLIAGYGDMYGHGDPMLPINITHIEPVHGIIIPPGYRSPLYHFPNLEEFHVRYLYDTKNVANFKAHLSNLNIQRSVLFFQKCNEHLSTFWDSAVNVSVSINGAKLLKIDHNQNTLIISRIAKAAKDLLGGLKIGPTEDSLSPVHNVYLEDISIDNLFSMIPTAHLQSLTLRKVKGIKNRSAFLSEAVNLEEFSCDDMGDEVVDFGLHIKVEIEEGETPSKIRRLALGKARLDTSGTSTLVHHNSSLQELYLDNCKLTQNFVDSFPSLFPNLKKVKVCRNSSVQMVVQFLKVPTLEWMCIWDLPLQRPKSKRKKQGLFPTPCLQSQEGGGETNAMEDMLTLLVDAGVGPDKQSLLHTKHVTFLLERNTDPALGPVPWKGSKVKDKHNEFTKLDYVQFGWDHFYSDYDLFYRMNNNPRFKAKK